MALVQVPPLVGGGLGDQGYKDREAQGGQAFTHAGDEGGVGRGVLRVDELEVHVQPPVPLLLDGLQQAGRQAVLHRPVGEDGMGQLVGEGALLGESGQVKDGLYPHGFGGVPAVEYIENEERMGIFESALPMIDAYNKAISEKANDVDYFADAYLKILGSKLEKEELEQLRRNRIINFEGDDAASLIVEFLQKPDGDTTQENLINRLEKLIFQISMVANISDENFGASSGIALKYKLQAMSNLAKTKERKFTSGMNRRYKLIFSNPVSGMQKDSWVGIKYQFTQNYPANILEESQIAGNLAGITSQETQLKVLSIVDNVQQELERIAEEESTAQDDVVMRQMFGNPEGGSAGDTAGGRSTR